MPIIDRQYVYTWWHFIWKSCERNNFCYSLAHSLSRVAYNTCILYNIPVLYFIHLTNWSVVHVQVLLRENIWNVDTSVKSWSLWVLNVYYIYMYISLYILDRTICQLPSVGNSCLKLLWFIGLLFMVYQHLNATLSKEFLFNF